MSKQLASLTKIIFHPILVGITMFLCGLVVGLPVLGWWLWPVKWVDIPLGAMDE